jgi:hypothetical protein
MQLPTAIYRKLRNPASLCLGLLSYLDPIHDLAIAGMEVRDSKSQIVLRHRVHRPLKHDRRVADFSINVSTSELWLCSESVYDLTLDLSIRQLLRRRSLRFRWHLGSRFGLTLGERWRRLVWRIGR